MAVQLGQQKLHTGCYYFQWVDRLFVFDILQSSVCAVAVEALRHPLAPRLLPA
jgi:hypothetical protein